MDRISKTATHRRVTRSVKCAVAAALAAWVALGASSPILAGSQPLSDRTLSARRTSTAKSLIVASANAAETGVGSKASAEADSKANSPTTPPSSDPSTAPKANPTKSSSAPGTLKKPELNPGGGASDLLRESNPLGKDRVTAAEIEAVKATKSIQELSDQLRQKNDEYILLQRNLRQKLEQAPNIIERRRLGEEINRLRSEFNRSVAPIRNEMKERVRELRQTLPDLNKPIGAGNEGGRPRRGNP